MSLFDDKDNLNELQTRIKDIEDWLSDEYNPMSMAEAEVRMFQNWDLNSGFQVNGVMITQMQINDKLGKIKTWLTELLYEYLPYIRFTAPMRTD